MVTPTLQEVHQVEENHILVVLEKEGLN